MEFVMTVGVPGSGKSYWARHQKDYIVLDSDAVREELYGDASDQQNPAKVFELMYRRACNALAAEKSVIYCATNIAMRYRVHTLKQVKRKFPFARFRCVVFNTTIDKCKEMNQQRERRVPEYVIDKHVRSFQMPVSNEGWDTIEIVTPFHYVTKEFGNKMWDDVRALGSQDNPHHTLSLYQHLNATISKVNLDEFSGDIEGVWSEKAEVLVAAGLHDIGKAYTREYDNNGVAHYFSHAELGAYLAMNMGAPREVIELVNYHMCPYMDKQAQITWQNRLGEELWHKVMILHEADEAAH